VRGRRHLLLGLFLAAAAAVGAAQSTSGLETFDRAWTIVRDTHFDRVMNGVDWDAVRVELRPRAAAATTPGELRAVIREMLGRLGLSHFALIPASADAPGEIPSDRSGVPGFDVRLIDGLVVVTDVDADGPAAAAGVRPGWAITEIDGTPVGRVIGHLPGDAPARLTDVEAWRALQLRLRGPAGSTAAVRFDTGAGEPQQVSIARRAESGQPVTIGHLPTMQVRVSSEARRTPAGHRVGLIRFNVWMPLVDRRFQEAIDSFRSADGIVIDLRGNPGGLAAMLMGISGHFVEKPVPLGIMKTRDAELRFTANPRLTSAAGQRVAPFAGPVAIVVDGLSGSATECFAGGMQAIGRARVFGQTTMGQALPALFDQLPNGDLMIHAYGDFVTADGTRLEGRGVVPDETVPLRRGDLLAGRDTPVEAALAWIDRSARAVEGR
jgi:carboxyl-terminal processing protease